VGLLHTADHPGLVLHAQSRAGRAVGRVRKGEGEGGGPGGIPEDAPPESDGQRINQLHRLDRAGRRGHSVREDHHRGGEETHHGDAAHLRNEKDEDSQ